MTVTRIEPQVSTIEHPVSRHFDTAWSSVAHQLRVGRLGPRVRLPGMTPSATDQHVLARRRIIRDGVGIGIATGTYGLSFGALGVVAGLSTFQVCALSLLMFTGASQFAFVGVVGAGGSAAAAGASAVLLGSRNALYGLHLSPLLAVRGARRAAVAHLVIDESAAMSLAGGTSRGLSRLGFYVTGLAVFAGWNLATLLGALGAQSLADPGRYGLDVVAPAAFLALLAPRMRERRSWYAAVLAVVVAVASVPFVPAGAPVLLGAAAVILWVLGASSSDSNDSKGSESTGGSGDSGGTGGSGEDRKRGSTA